MSLSERYDLLQHLYDGRSVTVYRGRDRQSGASVILKTRKRGSGTIERLQHEYSIREGLDLPGVVRAYGLVEHGTEVALVLDDLGGETLRARIAKGILPLRDTLRIGGELAAVLGQIHQRRVIHKDINPSNILLDEGGHAHVFDFDIATSLPREIQSIQVPNLLSGTLPYISPEQTGRMNRAIDYRTDLYSLGVTLYEMLTGRVPFSSQDPLELVHCHIAKTPTPPNWIDPGIPVVASDIVMKLLEKTAEARYQSAFGLNADLEECLRRLDQLGSIEPFSIGQQDISDRFQIPQKLYGREAEIAALEGAFARVQQATLELFLVTGSSGIGKSSVIHELYRSLSQSRGYFVSGKFDQLKRDIPYSALLQALTELVKSLLAEPDEQLAIFRQCILDAVGGNGRVLTDVLPDLERIIGPQPPVPDLLPGQVRNRFRLLFQNFIRVFTQRGQPLVLFLDDLQWIDAATLDLLTLLGDPKGGALLVIGAYRDNEVSAGHPLLSTLTALEKDGCRISRLALGPISAEHIGQLIEETLAVTKPEALPLAELLSRRTGGNPLFVGELLGMLRKNGFIEFNPGRRRWTFDFAQIERAPGTDNIGQLMATRAATLGERTRESLQLAAVLGNQFELDRLAVVAQCPPNEVQGALAEALQEGLVLAIGERQHTVYRFVHDRVQQAVYASIPEDRRAEIHHRTGQLLLQNRPEEEHDDWLFEVVHHLNLAASLVQDINERIEVGRLNLAAAKRARASAAFATAASHYAAGIGFLPAEAWTSQHEIMFEMHLGRAECEYLSGNDAAAEQLFDVVLQRARTDTERVQAYMHMAAYMLNASKYREAMSMALKALDVLGIKIGMDVTPPRFLYEFLKIKRALRGKSPSELLNDRAATDPRVQLIFRALSVATLAAYLGASQVFGLIVLMMVRISLEHGNSSLSAFGYMSYAMMISALLSDYAGAEVYGRLALDFCERYPDKSIEVPIKHAVAAYILPRRKPWRRPYTEGTRYLLESQQDGLMSGEVTFTAYAFYSHALLLEVTGYPLETVRQTCEQHLQFSRSFKNEFVKGAILCNRQASCALQGLTKDIGSFNTIDFDEARFIATLTERSSGLESERGVLYIFWFYKAVVLYILGRQEEALSLYTDHAKNWAAVDKSWAGHFVETQHRYFEALILASGIEGKGVVARQRDLLVFRNYIRKFKKWADAAPMNFGHRYLILCAELSRLTNDYHSAIGQYEEAIAIARENEYLQDEAIALELASRCARARGLHDVTIAYLARAREAYALWGARAKVALLDEAYPGLAARAEGDVRAASQPVTTTSSTTTTSTLDVPSMIKASQALSGEITLDKLLLRLMEVVAENAGAERGSLVLKQRGVLAVVAEFTTRGRASLPTQPVPVAASSNLSAAIVNYVFRTHETVILRDATKEGSFTSDAYVSASRTAKAVLCTPLLQKGEVTGAIYLENNLVPGAFTHERAKFLSVLCAQMAISIDNSHLYADLEQKVIERTRALKEAQARLIQLERETTEMQMAGGFAHEVRNALAGARIALTKVYHQDGDAEPWSVCVENSQTMKEIFLHVRDHVSQETLEPVAKMLGNINDKEKVLNTVLANIHRALTRGLGITSLILEYAQIARDRPGTDVVSVPTLVTSVLDDLEDDFAAHRISVEVSVPPGSTIVGKELHFHSILKNLVLNARDALLEVGEDHGRAISIQALEEPTRLVLSVQDTGAGIPAEVQDKVFEPFFSTKPTTGTGLGLGMCRKLASLYGGSIDFDSAVERGTMFRVVLPKESRRSAVSG